MSSFKDKINAANSETIKVLMSGMPIWVGCKPALDVIPGMTKNTILHAGPPILWEDMCGPMKNGVLGAIVYENLASNLKEAEKIVEAGKIHLAPCHDYNAVGGMTGVTSASMPMFIVHNKTFDNYAYCASHEGSSPKGFGWGTNDAETIAHTLWIQNELGPVLDAALQASGGINLKEIIGRAIQMGDELHGRCGAATCLITRELAPHFVRLNFSKDQIAKVLDFLLVSDIFALHVIMAAARSIVEPAKGIKNSTIVTTMARNGVEFGIKISAFKDRWFKGPAQPIETIFFSPKWTSVDANPDIGDSSIVETIGLGGMIHAASPAQEFSFGGKYSDAVKKTQDAYEFCAAEHDAWTIPNFDFRGIPFGIDIRKVVNLGITPILDTATAHIDGGKIGIGEARAPIEGFEEALRALAQEMEVDD